MLARIRVPVTSDESTHSSLRRRRSGLSNEVNYQPRPQGVVVLGTVLSPPRTGRGWTGRRRVPSGLKRAVPAHPARVCQRATCGNGGQGFVTGSSFGASPVDPAETWRSRPGQTPPTVATESAEASTYRIDAWRRAPSPSPGGQYATAPQLFAPTGCDPCTGVRRMTGKGRVDHENPPRGPYLPLSTESLFSLS